MLVLLPDLNVHVVVGPAHAGHVARPSHCPAPGRAVSSDNLEKVRKLETLRGKRAFYSFFCFHKCVYTLSILLIAKLFEATVADMDGILLEQFTM